MTIRADSSPGTTSRQLGTQTEFAVMTCAPKGVSVTKEPTRPRRILPPQSQTRS